MRSFQILVCLCFLSGAVFAADLKIKILDP